MRQFMLSILPVYTALVAYKDNFRIPGYFQTHPHALSSAFFTFATSFPLIASEYIRHLHSDTVWNLISVELLPYTTYKSFWDIVNEHLPCIVNGTLNIKEYSFHGAISFGYGWYSRIFLCLNEVLKLLSPKHPDMKMLSACVKRLEIEIQNNCNTAEAPSDLAYD